MLGDGGRIRPAAYLLRFSQVRIPSVLASRREGVVGLLVGIAKVGAAVGSQVGACADKPGGYVCTSELAVIESGFDPQYSSTGHLLSQKAEVAPTETFGNTTRLPMSPPLGALATT